MISAHRAAQRRDLVACSDGIAAWLRGDDSEAAEAAGINVAETYSMAHAWLKAQMNR